MEEKHDMEATDEKASAVACEQEQNSQTESPIENAPEQKSEVASERKADPAARSRRVKIAVAVAVVAVCAVVFGATAASGLLAPGNSLMQTTQESAQQDDSSQSGTSSDQAKEESSASQSTQTSAAVSEQAAATAAQPEAAAPAAAEAGTSEPAASSDATAAAAAAPQSAASAPAASVPSTIQVSVYVDTSRASKLGYSACMANEAVTVDDGASVYDALVATGLSVGGSSNYVRSIGGLAEFQGGSGSGWIYVVDGSRPSIGCGSYALHGGESIRWAYTLDLGKDV